MKEKREVDLSQKGTLEAVELSDDEMEKVNGGYKKIALKYFECPGNCGGACVNQCHSAICFFNYKWCGNIITH